MSQQMPVDILSDSDSEPQDNRRPFLVNDAVDLTTPSPIPHLKKRLRTDEPSNPDSSTVFIIDDDPTPLKQRQSSVDPTSSATPSFVAETPFSDASLIRCSRIKCSSLDLTAEQLVVADTPMPELSEGNSGYRSQHTTQDFQLQNALDKPICSVISKHMATEPSGLICVESDNETELYDGFGVRKHSETVFVERTMETESGSRFTQSSFSLGSVPKNDLGSVSGTSFELQKGPSLGNADEIQNLGDCIGPSLLEEDISLDFVHCNDKPGNLEPAEQDMNQSIGDEVYRNEKTKGKKPMNPKKVSKEDRILLMEERKQQKEREKLLKASLKAEAAEMKKRQKEMQKWEKGKYALKSIVAEIDRKVVELGSIGGHLLTRFAEKGLSYRITSNPVERSIMWSMAVPEEISLTSSEQIEISYVLIIYEAEEFCNVVVNGSFMNHVQSVQHCYPHHTICYLTNRLMAYINKREQAHYKNPAANNSWKRPPIEEAFATLATHFFKVHSRQCVDEAEIAEHIVGLTCSLASCQFRKKLTRLSVNANGSVIPKDCVDKDLIKKNLWLKALVAIPKVQPRFAVAIWKKYPTMKSLLHVYMDPTKSVHEKEFLLKDLPVEGLLGGDRRVGEICSKRICRILMAQCGSIKTDDVENGADFFTRKST